MKKKLQKKLAFNKATVAHLDSKEKNMIRGGVETDLLSTCPTGACTTCNTYCGSCDTCYDTCGSIVCETDRPRLCPTELCM